MTLLESFTVTDWTIVAAGCVLVVLGPALVIAALSVVVGRTVRFLTARQAAAASPVPAEPDWDWPEGEGDEWDDVREVIHRERNR